MGYWARSEKSRARELIGMPVGQVVSRMKEEQTSAEVIYSFIEEFVDTVEKLGGTLDAAEKGEA
jgi:hypothetical protein